MDVWEPFRRRGFGTGLLYAVCAAARQAGAKHAVLNATPDHWWGRIETAVRRTQKGALGKRS